MARNALSARQDEYKRIPGREAAGKSADEVNGEHVSLKRLVKESAPEAWTLIGATIAMFVSALSTLAIPALFGRVIDVLTAQAADGQDRAADLRMAIFALIAVSLIGAIFSFVRSYLFSVAGERVVARLRRKLFAALMYVQQQEIGWYDQTRVGELISRLGGDTTVLKDAATSNISMALRWSATVVGGVAYLFLVNWKLTLVMLAIVPAVAISARLYGKYTRKLSKDTRQALAEATEIAEESMSSIRTVRSFSNEPRQEQVFNRKIDETLRLGIKASVAYGGFTGGTTGVTLLAFIAIVYYGGTLVLAGEMTSGALTSFLLYALTIGAALGGISGVFGSMMSAVGANDRVFQILDRVPLVPVADGEILASVTGNIEFRGVTFAYPSRPDTSVLRNLSMRIPAGAVAALVGPSGAGKSTIISLIERFYDVNQGSVLIDDKDVSSLNGAALRRHIAVVLQEPVLFFGSIADNIRFGNEAATTDEVIAAAKTANAHSFIREFSDGYDTLVGERGVRLSGGQKQRVAIARAILQNPSILLLDEATSALDAESEHLVKEALERLMRGRTTLIVAHRLSTVRQADVVFVITDGRVAEHGTHEQLLQSSEMYAQLVRRQLLAASTLHADGNDARDSSGGGAAGAAQTAGTATAAAPQVGDSGDVGFV